MIKFDQHQFTITIKCKNDKDQSYLVGEFKISTNTRPVSGRFLIVFSPSKARYEVSYRLSIPLTSFPRNSLKLPLYTCGLNGLLAFENPSLPPFLFFFKFIYLYIYIYIYIIYNSSRFYLFLNCNTFI